MQDSRKVQELVQKGLKELQTMKVCKHGRIYDVQADNMGSGRQ